MSDPISYLKSVIASSAQPKNNDQGAAQFLRWSVAPISAGLSILPTFYGFQRKSALQSFGSAPKFRPVSAFVGGVKASPTIAAIIGSQILMQGGIEERLPQTKESKNKNMFVSCSIVALFSIPGFIVFNGQTLGRSPLNSLRAATLAQGLSIFSREETFLGSVRVSGPVGDALKKSGGDHKVAEIAGHFATGAIGSVIGHPGDTALTWLQNGLKIGETIRTHGVFSLYRGVVPKAVATGAFVVCFKEIMNKFS